MESKWSGKAVSIECEQRLGIFQGIIKDISAEEITIVRAFRNGIPLRKQDAEVTLKSSDILKIDLIPSYNGQSTLTPIVINKPTPVKLPSFNANTGNSSTATTSSSVSTSNGVQPQQLPTWSTKDNVLSMAKKLSNMKVNNINGLKRVSNATRTNSTQTNQVQQMPGDFLNDSAVKSLPSTPCNNSVSQFFGNLIPPKVEVRMGSAFSSCSSNAINASPLFGGHVDDLSNRSNVSHCVSKPIDIVNGRGTTQSSSSYNGSGGSNSNGNSNGNAKLRNGNGHGYSQNGIISQMGSLNTNGGGGNGGSNGKLSRRQRKQLSRETSMRQQNRAFATSVDDPLLNEDFDFEGNLALFDKKALWNVIESENQRQPEASQPTKQKKYRHDENVLVHDPPQMRRIEAIFDGSNDFVTDEGLIIPTIPHFVRSKIELTADRNGLTIQRQIDVLARGATDVAISILGGARRLTPNNCHQWPKIIIICEKSANYRSANIGAATGRHLASHGIEVVLYLEDNATIEQKNNEISLFKATGNSVVYSVNDLSTPDLVILSTNTINLSSDVKEWLGDNRASIFAIDPPTSGIRDITIKCAILPILPLNGISTENCGKLYLCNLGIPEKFYRDAGVKYKSPFGHKFVIPIHPKH